VRIYSGGTSVGGTTPSGGAGPGVSSFSFERTLPDKRNVLFVGDGGFTSSGTLSTTLYNPFKIDANGRPTFVDFGRNSSERRNVNNAAFFANIMLWGFSRLDDTDIPFD
jgi:hypothetical protein